MNNWINWVIFGCLVIGLFFGVNKLAYGEYGKPNSPLSGSMSKQDMTSVRRTSENNLGQYLVKASLPMEIGGFEKPAYIAETLSMWVM